VWTLSRARAQKTRSTGVCAPNGWVQKRCITQKIAQVHCSFGCFKPLTERSVCMYSQHHEQNETGRIFREPKFYIAPLLRINFVASFETYVSYLVRWITMNLSWGVVISYLWNGVYVQSGTGAGFSQSTSVFPPQSSLLQCANPYSSSNIATAEFSYW